MRACAACGAENPDDATRCAACSRPLVALPRPRSVQPAPRPTDLTPTPLPPVVAPEPTTTLVVPPAPAPPARGPAVLPLPDVPDGGIVPHARYAVAFARARWSRRKAIRVLGGEIQERVTALDGELGAIGQLARDQKLDLRVLDEENGAIDGAEHRRAVAERALAETAAKTADENSRFDVTERDLEAKLAAAETAAETAAAELTRLEDERNERRASKRELEKRQRWYVKGAERREAQAAKAPMGEQRSALRRSAEDMRADAARLEPQREKLEKQLAAGEAPLGEASTLAEATRADRDALRRTLEDSRTGHVHRVAELEAERAHNARESADAAAEIRRRLITLGTIANLNRVPSPELSPPFARVDALRAAIGEREADIDRLTAERGRYDRGALTRGAAVLGGALAVLITVVSVLIAVLS